MNKIDRLGASPDATLSSIRERLTDSVIPLGLVRRAGSRLADFSPFGPGDREFVQDLAADLAEHQDGLLAALGDGKDLPYVSLRCELARQTKASLVHPLIFGSALTGAGISPLKTAIVELLPAHSGDRDGPLSATVFKVDRSVKGEKLAYVRLFSGALSVRERVGPTSGKPDKVTAIAVFAEGSLISRPVLEAGQIGKISGLKSARIGDVLGDLPPRGAMAQFAPPTLTTRVAPLSERDAPRLVAALSELAEQDPLIGVRLDRRSGEISVSLYGEVQREVIEATLERDYGLSAHFEAVTPLYVERPKGVGGSARIDARATEPVPCHHRLSCRARRSELWARVPPRGRPMGRSPPHLHNRRELHCPRGVLGLRNTQRGPLRLECDRLHRHDGPLPLWRLRRSTIATRKLLAFRLPVLDADRRHGGTAGGRVGRL